MRNLRLYGLKLIGKYLSHSEPKFIQTHMGSVCLREHASLRRRPQAYGDDAAGKRETLT